ncbi:hypothetical protein F2P56_018707 [Juglans regia]|uniref:Uncharacterized protein LOC108981555 n=2 Tax=Juglans regia TaxID=51240 RepID=A0A2I4DMG0_JUGRE|nr:uncharacterized protein LOC108981555 [Juglans regia]XP_018808318.1 uncharacterized protein LOC108981555 [Juglans regia]KAF5462724.1 hypothetical protein F2P56_018707 [Juglans regia]
MDIVVQIVAKMAEHTVAPIGQWLGYSFRYISNVAKMKDREDKLRRVRDSVQHSIDAAVRNGEEIEYDVKKWLTEVDDITELAKKVHEGEEEAKMRCSIEVCLSLKLRHQLSREAKKIVKLVGKALENGKFDRISYRPAPQGIVTRRNMNCMEFVSRAPTVKGLKEALGDANINVIGLWGMPGAGKTTLMREVARQVKEEDKLFDEVALADVTQSRDLIRIQGEIADMLDLKLDMETKRGRAIRLRERLTTKEKRILVILDDIWEKLDLEEIGIDPCKGCKVVLVSRQRNLLSEMGIQKNFEIEVLPEKEAWELFEKMAADSVKNPNLRPIAIEVAKECGGLPIALATVSKALNNKDLCEWKDALQQLRRPAPELPIGMQSTIYSCIELSYKHLASEEIKNLFLHCAEMEFGIYHQDLLKYCYGLGLFHGINTLEDARNRLYGQLHNLKDSCLLQDCPRKSDHCHMHDIVRYVAKSIASKDYYMLFMREDGGLKERPDMDALKICKAFSIRGRDIDQLPNELECPKLRFLLVDGKGRSLQIPDTFFQGMKKLKVLDLTAMKLSSLPSSLLLLRNLQTLCLDHCELGDISGIGELKNLVVLSLLHSDISTLPREIGSLVHLRLLDLTDCSKLEVIPPNVLPSLVELEELYMGNSFVQWEAEGLITERSNNANLAELKYMLRLTTLEIHIRDACMLPKYLRFGKLERYNILVGDVWDWSDKHECSRTLKLKLKTSFQSEVGITMLLNRTECLYLDELKGVKSVLHELDQEGFQQLKHLHIQNNDEIKYIIISSPMHISTISFPALEIFHLKNMTGLEDIFHGQLHSTSFRNLRAVKVENCEKLKFVFPSSVARGLSQLQELRIRECSIMGAIVVKEGGEVEDTDMIFFPQLRLLALEHLPKLMTFLRTKNSFGPEVGEIVSEGTLDFDMPILHEQVVFPNLEILELSSVDLEETKHNQHRARLSCRLTTMEAMSRFQNLSILEVQGSCNIKYLLSFSTARFMVHLKHLHIYECKAMEEVLVIEDIAAAGEITKEVFPQLECLELIDLPSLKRFCVGCNIQFPSLENMCIEHCPNLVTFIFNPTSSSATTSQEIIHTNAEERPPTVMQPLFNVEVAFPCLKRLKICRMDYLKLIWQNQFVENAFGNLQIIIVELCENLVSIFQSDILARFQSVEKLSIADCTSLQQVFDLQELNVNENQAVTTIQLKVLVLARLPQMKHVWSKDPKAVFNFKNLKQIEADGCENLRSFFPASVARSLMQLEHLAIIDCGVEEIVEGEVREDEIEWFVFPHVTLLTLKRLARLKWFYPGVHTLECPMLKEMWVEGCQKVDIFAYGLLSFQETLRESQHEISTQQPLFLVHEVAFPSLEKLVISHMDNLITIWHDQVAADSFCNFQNLRQINAEGCKSLKSFFPTVSMATSLMQLEDLRIVNCRIEEIVARGGEEATPRFVFPNLTSLELGILPKLKWIFPGAHNLEWPVLKTLKAWGCDQVSIFASKFSRFQETSQQCLLESSIQHPLFLVEEGTFPKLEALKSDLQHTIWYAQFFVESFCKLKVLEVKCNDDTSVLSLSNLLKRLQNLEKLVVSCNSWQEIISYEDFIGPEKQTRILPRLKELRVSEAPMLTHLWKEDVQESLVFDKVLEILAVSECHKLRSLVPSSAYFHNLTDLEILSCNGLINLITYTTAKSLVQLRKMSVSSCEGITEIVARGDDQAKVVITFSKLTCLKFDCLPNFTSFCSGSYSIKFPYLEEVIVGECPVMKTFCHGVLSTPKLKGVQAKRGEESHTRWKLDLNTTIHSLWENKPV